MLHLAECGIIYCKHLPTRNYISHASLHVIEAIGLSYANGMGVVVMYILSELRTLNFGCTFIFIHVPGECKRLQVPRGGWSHDIEGAGVMNNLVKGLLPTKNVWVGSKYYYSLGIQLYA